MPLTQSHERPPLKGARGVAFRTFAWPWIGLATALVLMAMAVLLPRETHWQVLSHLPPLRASWRPRWGPGSYAALAVAVLSLGWTQRYAKSFRWPVLLGATWATSLVWVFSLNSVDGLQGLKDHIQLSDQYLGTARATSNVSTMLGGYIARIPISASPHLSVHLSAHPPGALLVYVLLVRIGLGGNLPAGVVTTLVASTAPVAVLVTLRVLGAEKRARLAAPFLVLSPAAIWWAELADGLFAAVAAWGIAALAIAATRRSIGWSLLAGASLGYCLMLSYGLILMGILALAVLMVARSWFSLSWAVAAALGMVLIFAVEGFAWWDAFPVVRQRYWDGVASQRPASYWLWADFAALGVSAGPVMFAGVFQTLARGRSYLTERATRPIVLIVAAATIMVAVADFSLMSKGEVERIWLPFIPWLLVGCALLSRRWAWYGLAVQLTAALLVQNLLSIPR